MLRLKSEGCAALRYASLVPLVDGKLITANQERQWNALALAVGSRPIRSKGKLGLSRTDACNRCTSERKSERVKCYIKTAVQGGLSTAVTGRRYAPDFSSESSTRGATAYPTAPGPNRMVT